MSQPAEQGTSGLQEGEASLAPCNGQGCGRSQPGIQASVCFILKKLSLELRMPAACRSLDHGRAELP